MPLENVRKQVGRSNNVRPYLYSALAAVVVPALLFAYVSWQDYKSEMRELEHEVLRTTEIFHRHALNVFVAHQLIFEAVNTRLNGMGWDEISHSQAISAYLKKLADNCTQVQAIWLADSSGMIRSASQPLPASPVTVADRDYFQALQSGYEGIFVGHIVFARVMKGLNFNVALRREGPSGAFDGVIILSVFPEYFRDFWQGAMLNQDSVVALVRGDGSMLARAPRLDPDILKLPPTSSVVQAIRKSDQGSFYGMSIYDRSRRFFAFRELDDLNIFVVHGISTKAALKEWHKNLLHYGALFGAASAGLFLLAMLAIRRARDEQQAVLRWQETAELLTAKSIELDNTAQRLQLATEAGQLGVWEWDIPTGALIWNDRMFEIYGVRREDITLGLNTWQATVHPDDRESRAAAIELALSGKNQLDTEFRIIQPGGTVRHIQANGLVIRDADDNAQRMIGINRDISERKALEAELTAHREHLEELVAKRTLELSEAVQALQLEVSERQRIETERRYLAAIVESTDDAIIGKSLDGIIQAWNRGAERLYGYSEDEVKGQSISMLLPAERSEELANILRHISQGIHLDHYETVRLHRDGSLIDVSLTVSPIYDADGRVVGASTIARNISARKKVEAELRTLTDELERRVSERTAALSASSKELAESQRALLNIVDDLNSKTEEIEQANAKLKDMDRLKSLFIASMSHELRTPLNSIIGFSSIMHDEWTGPVNAKQKENLAIILRSGNHLLSLINDVIDVSKIEAGKIELIAEEFDLYDLIDEAVTLITKDIEAKGLTLQLTSLHLPMQTDRRRLLQCLLNLLSNAVKFTQQGNISVTARVINGDGDAKATEFAEICVADTGLGISKTDMEKMFHPFVRLVSPLQATIPGTGLGLYLTRKLVVEILKGDLSLTSEFGKGSKFTLRTPVRLS